MPIKILILCIILYILSLFLYSLLSLPKSITNVHCPGASFSEGWGVQILVVIRNRLYPTAFCCQQWPVNHFFPACLCILVGHISISFSISLSLVSHLLNQVFSSKIDWQTYGPITATLSTNQQKQVWVFKKNQHPNIIRRQYLYLIIIFWLLNQRFCIDTHTHTHILHTYIYIHTHRIIYIIHNI